MNVLKITAVTFFLINITLQFQDLMDDFIAQLIYINFNITSCLHVITSDTNLNTFLKSVMVPIVITQDRTEYYKKLPCDGYLILGNYKKFNFRVHKRIVAVFESGSVLNYSIFETNRNLNGMDVVTVEGFKFNDNTLVRNEIFIKSLTTGEVLYKWDMKTKFIVTKKIFKPKWQPVFKNNALRAATINTPPYVFYDPRFGVYEGLEYRIFQSITQDWPVNYKIYSGDFMFSQLKEDVAKNFHDVGFGSFWDLASVSYKVDISFPYSQTCVTFLVPKPTLLPVITYVYQPLTLNVWLLLFVLTTLIGIIFSVILKKTINDTTIGFMYSIRTITLSGIPVYSYFDKNYFNFALIVWNILSLVITTGYSSGLSSIVSYPRHTKPINTLQDMVEHKIFWTAADSDTTNIYRDSNNAALRRLANNFVLEVNANERMKKVRKGNMAIKVQNSVNTFLDITDLSAEEKRRLKLLSQCAGVYLLTYVFKHNSPFTEIFDDAIKRLVEHGFVIYYASAINSKINDASAFDGNNQNDPIPLTIAQLQGAFYLLLCGLIFAILLFIAELYYKNK